MWLLIREASAARNLEALLPPSPRVRPLAHRVLHRRPRAGAHRRRGPRQLDGARGGRAGHRARGRDRDGVAQRRDVARARPPRRGRAGLPGRSARPPRPRTLRARGRAEARATGRRVPRPEVPEWVKHTVRVAPTSPEDFAIRLGRRPSARDRRDPGPDRDRVARRGADRPATAASSPTRPRPGEDRGRRAPSRHRPDRARARARLRPSARGRSARRSRTTRTTSSSSA